MSTVCRRLWEVEAARDGRLTGQALLAFEKHAKSCRDCARERAALDDLKRRLAEAAPAPDEVLLRRERDRLLAAADARGRARVHAPYIRWAVAAIAAVALSAGVWLGVRGKFAKPQSDSYAAITPSAGARWERRRHAGVDEIELYEGTLSLAVHRFVSDPRVSVRVPDGEIEDLGTEFYVAVREGRTREIAVRSGAVVFHSRDHGAELVTSGSVWRPAEPSARVSPESLQEFTTATPPRTPAAVHARRGEHHAASHAAPSAPPPREPDPSAEDAAFLRILALRREHRSEEARAAAAKYLEAFPSGFRRAEVLRFVMTPR